MSHEVRMNKDVHPNMVPVVCMKPTDLLPLVEEMRSTCRNEPSNEAVEYSPNVEAALENARQEPVRNNVIESGHTRVFVIPGPPPEGAIVVPSNIPLTLITVVLTLDLFPERCRWNLSMSSPGTSGVPVKLSEGIAKTVATLFLGPGFEEIEPEGAFKTIHQFILEELPLPTE